MSATVHRSRDGSVSISVDGGSTIRGVTVGDKVVVDDDGNIDVIADDMVISRTILPPPPGFWDRPAGRLAAYGGLLLFCLAFWVAVICGLARVAHGADCSVLHDADARHLCIAETNHLLSECEFIKDRDLRQTCRIRVGGHR